MRISSYIPPSYARSVCGAFPYWSSRDAGREDKPAPLPNVPASAAPADSKTAASPTTGKAAGSASSANASPGLAGPSK